MENEPIRFVTPKMLDAILQKLVNPMDRAMLLLASEGLKTEEIVRLTIDDVDFKNSLIRIQGEDSVYCIPVCQKTIDECLAAHKQRTYKSLATMLEMKPQKVVNSKYIIRPINSKRCLPHMVKMGADYRIKNIFLTQNIGITIIGGTESIRNGRMMYELYNSRNNRMRFSDSVMLVLNKFYRRTEHPLDNLTRKKRYIAEMYRRYATEFESVLNNEDVFINKISSTVVCKERETISSITEKLTMNADLKQLSIDKAVEHYLLSIKQKMPHHSVQSVEKMVDQLTKWSKKNDVSISNFIKNNAVEFIVSLNPKGRAEIERHIPTASNFFKYLCATGNAAQNPFEDLDVEEVWEARNRLKKK